MTVYSDFDNELPVNRISAFVPFLEHCTSNLPSKLGLLAAILSPSPTSSLTFALPLALSLLGVAGADAKLALLNGELHELDPDEL